VLQFLDLPLQLLHLCLQLLHLVDQAGAGLVLVLCLLFQPRDTIGEAQPRVLRECREREQHGGRDRARHAEPGCKAVSQSLHHYCAV